MKVCHITSVHRYDDTRIFIKECQSLAKEYETHLIAPEAPDDFENGIHIHGVQKTGKSRLSRMTQTVRDVYQKALEVDAELYHFHDPELIFVGLLLKRKGKKVIYDVHEDVPRQLLSKDWLPKPVRKVIAAVFEVAENYVAKRLDAIVVATPHIRERFNKIRKDTIDINNYPILSELSITTNNDWDQKDGNVTYIGGINKIRGIYEIVEAIGKSSGTLLLGGKFTTVNDHTAVSEIDGWDKVKELGHLSRQEMAKVLNRSCAGLVLFHPLPNHVNAQPNKMFEYMSSGIPVIASNFQLWKDIIEGNDCGICVDPLDTDAIAKAISYLTSNLDEAKRLGENGKKAVAEKYNWDVEKAKLLSLYQNLLYGGKNNESTYVRSN